jgi:leucyl aminopeptidase
MAATSRRGKKGVARDPLPPYTRTLDFAAASSAPATSRTDALVVYAFESGRSVEGLDSGDLRQAVDHLVASEGFRAKRGGTLLFHTPGKFAPKRVIVAGLGRRDDFDLDALRQAAGSAARRADAASARTITFAAPPASSHQVADPGERARAVAEGCLLGLYRLRKYFTGERLEEDGSLRKGEILASPADLGAVTRGVRRATSVSLATNLARDLVNEPAMALTPVRMADVASALAARSGIECFIHDETWLERMGMGAFLGVSRGSHQPPRLIHLIYRPGGKPSKRVALVGKGITFDSGGLSIKTSSGMETMKLDKAGAVAVLAAMLSLPEMKPKVEVHGLLGMTENMPGGSAIKPGDVLRTTEGKTIEVLNTDAEGRLVLADLLSHSRKLGVDEVIDLATLTGACMVALGPLAGGLFSNDDALASRLLQASRHAGEKLWRLPLYEEYTDQLKSEIADIKNTADRYGSAITAALFLREFVDAKTPWAHLDIAGPAFLETAGHPYMRRGATGMGVRTLLSYFSSGV